MKTIEELRAEDEKRRRKERWKERLDISMAIGSALVVSAILLYFGYKLLAEPTCIGEDGWTYTDFDLCQRASRYQTERPQ